MRFMHLGSISCCHASGSGYSAKMKSMLILSTIWYSMARNALFVFDLQFDYWPGLPLTCTAVDHLFSGLWRRISSYYPLKLVVYKILHFWLSSVLSVCVYSYAHVIAKTNACKNVVLRACGRLWGSISYFLATRSSQMNAEAATDVDPNY